jgi:hypothetical protein
MADPFEEFVNKTGGLADMPEEGEPQAIGPDVGGRKFVVQQPAENATGLLGDIAGILTNIAGVGLPTKGAVLTKAIGSKL